MIEKELLHDSNAYYFPRLYHPIIAQCPVYNDILDDILIYKIIQEIFGVIFTR